MTLEVADDHYLIIEHVGDFGYFVCGSVSTERDYFNLDNTRLGDAITEGTLAFEQNKFRRYALDTPSERTLE